MTPGIESNRRWLRATYKAGIVVLLKPFKRLVKRTIRNRFDMLPESVRLAMVNLWREIKIARTMRRSAKYLQTLQGKENLKVHLGCGRDMKLGWVNIDLNLRSKPGIDFDSDPDTVFINYDLRLGLPLDSNSCEFIYSSHFLEHLEYGHGVQLMQDSYRALRPGGVFRAALPNFRGLFAAYLQDDYDYVELVDILKVLPEVEPGTETLVDYINIGVYARGLHKCIYDEKKLILLLRKIGYHSVSSSSYQAGIDPDSPLRRRYSFYIEAIK